MLLVDIQQLCLMVATILNHKPIIICGFEEKGINYQIMARNNTPSLLHFSLNYCLQECLSRMRVLSTGL